MLGEEGGFNYFPLKRIKLSRGLYSIASRIPPGRVSRDVWEHFNKRLNKQTPFFARLRFLLLRFALLCLAWRRFASRCVAFFC